MDSAYRSSYRKTVRIAAGGALLIAALGTGLSLVVAPTAVILVAMGLVVPAVAVSLGGFIVMRRDDDIVNGRRDFFARTNRPRSELALGLDGPRRAPWIPRVWRAVVRHRRPVVGERVRIKSLEEIRKTLDSTGCVDGLPFMPEMAKYCGGVGRIFRSVDKIYDYGGAKDLRRMRNAVLLTGLRCDGSAHDGCQAHCYLIWKTVWLMRLDAGPGKDISLDGGSTDRKPPSMSIDESTRVAVVDPSKADARKQYTCQFTKLVDATAPMSARDPRQDLRALLEGNVTATAFAVALLTRLFRRVQRWRGGADYPYFAAVGGAPHEEPAKHGGALDWVRVRSREEIAATLDGRGRSRGLWFDSEMLKHCGQRQRVLRSVERIIDDASGKMLQMKTPCLVLENIEASGEFLRFCPQHEFIYWREAWLIADDDPAGKANGRR